MAAALLDMREVRKSQRRHAALLSGVYPFGHPILVNLVKRRVVVKMYAISEKNKDKEHAKALQVEIYGRCGEGCNGRDEGWTY